MSTAISEINFSALSQETKENIIRQLVGKLFWEWYYGNLDRKLTTIRWWFIRKTIYVRDLYGVFEILFGPPSIA